MLKHIISMGTFRLRSSNAVCIVVTLLGTAVLCDSAPAAVVITTGAVEFVSTPPQDVSSNHWESDTAIRLFPEQQGLTLAAALPLDISTPGTSPSANDANLSPSTVNAGNVVNSYALHFDVNGTRATNDPLEAAGSVTFDEPILGLIVLSDTLNSTNSVLSLSGVTYSNGTDHGLELNPAGGGTSDMIALSADRHTVSVDLRNAAFADDARIITAPVPEPGMGFLILFAAAAAILRRGRRVPAFPSPRIMSPVDLPVGRR